MKNFINNMIFTRASGIIFVAVGVFFVILNAFFIYYDNSYFPALLISGFILIFLGISLIIFPGKKFKKIDYPGQYIGINFVWENAPVLHRVMWIIALFIGTVIGIIITFFVSR